MISGFSPKYTNVTFGKNIIDREEKKQKLMKKKDSYVASFKRNTKLTLPLAIPASVVWIFLDSEKKPWLKAISFVITKYLIGTTVISSLILAILENEYKNKPNE